MREQPYRVAGDEVKIYFVETAADADTFLEWHSRQSLMGLDTETTGLDIFNGHVRLVQFGNARESYVLPAEKFKAQISRALKTKRYVLHNVTFDCLNLDNGGFATLEDLMPRCEDTRILAHLNDPRSMKDGGPGLRLKEIARVFVDSNADDGEKLLMAEFHKIGKTKDNGWAAIDLDNPVYWLYAGLDTILTHRLYPELKAAVAAIGCERLAGREHEIQRLLAKLERRGLRIDVEYTQRLSEQLAEDVERYGKIAARYGVNNVNSNPQKIAALQGMGEEWAPGEKTDTGQLSVAGAKLRQFADMDKGWDRVGFRDPNPLADSILRAMRANKWRKSYAEAFLASRDSNDRVHPKINGLEARTSRMSISNPPFQQLPANGWQIRRAIIADNGWVNIAADYAQVEMRVLAAEAGVTKMKEAIEQDISIHKYTASLLWPEGYPGWKYKIAKNTGFCRVYGGGDAKVAETSGVPLAEVKPITKAWDDTFPEVRRYSKMLQRKAQGGKLEVITPSGRHLPLDRDRVYSAANYVIQSTARDILAAALLRLEAAGLEQYLLLPVHDEVVAQAPRDIAEDVVREIGKVMETTFKGVKIDADAKVYGKSWGSGYVHDEMTEWEMNKAGILLPEGF